MSTQSQPTPRSEQTSRSRINSANTSCSRANSNSSWISVKKTNTTFKNHSTDKTLKKIDQTLDKEITFIRELEQKPYERDIKRKQAAELLNKRWNDEVYIPTQTSIQKTMDSNGENYSDQLQDQYAHYLNHSNISDGNVFLDVFDESQQSSNNNEYQPLKCQKIQAKILKPTAVDIKDPLKRQYKSQYARINDRSASDYSIAKNKSTTMFWSRLVKESSHIENPENVRRRRRIKISDVNRKSQLNWGSSA